MSLSASQLADLQLQLAERQTVAAFVAAGAAVVQAIGAVAAIFWSVKLAREAEHRRAEAEQRADQADRELERERFNAPISTIVAAADPLLSDLDIAIINATSAAKTSASTIYGTYRSKELTMFRATVDGVRETVEDPVLAAAVAAVSGAATPWDENLVLTWAAYARLHEELRDAIVAALGKLERLRKS